MGLKEEDKKEGLLKRLKNIEDKNKEQLKAIKTKMLPPMMMSLLIQKKLTMKLKRWTKRLMIDFCFVSSGKHRYNFSNFLNLKYFF